MRKRESGRHGKSADRVRLGLKDEALHGGNSGLPAIGPARRASGFIRVRVDVLRQFDTGAPCR
jgi:hypothetical protein